MPEINKTSEPNFESARVIAITGGIGSGKTEVSSYLKSKGFIVINTDDLAKDVMANDVNVKSRIKSSFGSTCYDENGNLNAKYLSSVVFTNDKNQSANVALLNSIVHPSVIELMVKQIEIEISKGNEIIFVESALIFESLLEDGFDYIICVVADDEVRINRVINRSGLKREQILLRMKEQLSQEKKIALSDFIIENNKSVNDLHQTIDFLLPILQSLGPNRKYAEEDDSE